MIHDPSTIAMGIANGYGEGDHHAQRGKESIINAYAAKTGHSETASVKL
jgi:ATP-dependent protease ClpP protease subunit